MKNRCMAHRGWSGKAPENTLSAIELALNHSGIDMIELDVQFSLDGVPVVIHDFTLERTTTGNGFVGSKTFQELNHLDVGQWFDPTFQTEKLPSLEDVLKTVNGKKLLNIEIKRPGDSYEGIEQAVVQLVRQYGMEEKVWITSFNHESIQKVSEMAPEIKRGPIVYGKPAKVDMLLKETDANILSMNYFYLTESIVKALLDKGIEIVAWTIDDPEWMKRTASLDQRIVICTNHPDRWLYL